MKTLLEIPLTKNHHQLAKWINEAQLVDDQGRAVTATVSKSKVSTDSKVAGTRFRRIGRGRASLKLEIYAAKAPLSKVVRNGQFSFREALYSHESGGTYRRHTEARTWVSNSLRHSRSVR